MRVERRNLSSVGRKRRRDFDRSVKKLRDLGMSEWAVEYYRRVARVAGLPPHVVVCQVAMITAGEQLKPEIAGEDLGPIMEAPTDSVTAPPGAPPPAAPRSARPPEQPATGLWQGIQHRASLLTSLLTRPVARGKRGPAAHAEIQPPAADGAGAVHGQLPEPPGDGKHPAARRPAKGRPRTL